MTPADSPPLLPGTNSMELQQLIHDLKTPLSIISMAVEALQSVRHDDAQFAHLSKMILDEGVKPLNAMIDSLGNGQRVES
jgi:signal transduction histidine kinase